MECSAEASCTISDWRSAVALARRGPDPHSNPRPQQQAPAAGALMSQWIWINGEIIPFSEARIGVEDRGFQFADGVYEVVRLYQGKPFTLIEHLDRLVRSAEAIGLSVPLGRDTLALEIGKLVAKSGHRDGMVY